MKKFLLLFLVLAAATAATAGERVFALTTAGEVDAALAERVRAKLEADTGAAVRLAPAIPLVPGMTLEAIGRAAAKTLAAGDHSIIVLARPDTPQPQGVCLPDVRFAALNLARLEAAGDPAKLERRIGQEGLRVLAMLLDMSMCPFPLCVLTGYEKTEDLDQMSGSYCPPCMERFDRVAREAGIRMVGAPGQAPAAAETPAAVEAAPAAAPEAPAAAPEAAPEHPEQPISLPFPAG